MSGFDRPFGWTSEGSPFGDGASRQHFQGSKIFFGSSTVSVPSAHPSTSSEGFAGNLPVNNASVLSSNPLEERHEVGANGTQKRPFQYDVVENSFGGRDRARESGYRTLGNLQGNNIPSMGAIGGQALANDGAVGANILGPAQSMPHGVTSQSVAGFGVGFTGTGLSHGTWLASVDHSKQGMSVDGTTVGRTGVPFGNAVQSYPSAARQPKGRTTEEREDAGIRTGNGDDAGKLHARKAGHPMGACEPIDNLQAVPREVKGISSRSNEFPSLSKREEGTYDKKKGESGVKNAQKAKRYLPVRMSSALANRPDSLRGASNKGKESRAMQQSTNDHSSDSMLRSHVEEEEEEVELDQHRRTASGAIVGTCEEMCPLEEIQRRQNMSDIQLFERVDPTNSSVTSVELAVKRFARTVDDPKASDFRTRDALHRTMTHLSRILDRTDVRFGLVHKFLWDRYRSVRQDLYIQGIEDDFAIKIFEQIVRFHVLSEHELCEEDQTVTNMEGFNSHLNLEQMNKALISLADMYTKAAADGRPAPNEAEFRAYHLLSLMSQHGKFKGDQQAFLSILQGLRPEVRNAPVVQWVLKLRSSFYSRNYIRFFKLILDAPYLCACLAHTYFGAVRADGLRALAESLSPAVARPALVEVEWLQHAFMLDSDEAVLKLCEAHGFPDSVVDSESGELAVVLVRGAYVDPSQPVEKRVSRVIQRKATAARSLIISFDSHTQESRVGEINVEQGLSQDGHKMPVPKASLRYHPKLALKPREESGKLSHDSGRRPEQTESHRERDDGKLKVDQNRRKQQELMEAKTLNLLDQQRRQKEAAAAAAEAEAKKAAAQRAWEKEQHRQNMIAEQERARRLEMERREAERLQMELKRREELEAQRIRQENEEKAEQKRLEELCSLVLRLRFVRKWISGTQKRIARRNRERRMQDSLKSCRVNVLPYRHPSVLERSQFAGDVDDLESVNWNKAVRRIVHRRAIAGRTDLLSACSLPLLERNPASNTLFWKLSVLDATGCSSSLSQWIAEKLSLGQVDATRFGKAYVGGVTALVDDLNRRANVKTCVSFPALMGSDININDVLGWCLKGCGGIIVVANNEAPNKGILWSILQSLKPLPPLPVLFLGASYLRSQEWSQAWLDMSGEMSTAMEIGLNAADSSADIGCSLGDLVPLAKFSEASLRQGLRWLASHAPGQPYLRVISLENLARELLSAAFESFGPSAEECREHPVERYVSAFKESLASLVSVLEESNKSIERRWEWPPPEIRDGIIQDCWEKENLEKVSRLIELVWEEAKGNAENWRSDARSLIMILYSCLRTFSGNQISHVVLPLIGVQKLEHETSRLRSLQWKKCDDDGKRPSHSILHQESSSCKKRKAQQLQDSCLIHNVIGNRSSFTRDLKHLKVEMAKERDEQHLLKLRASEMDTQHGESLLGACTPENILSEETRGSSPEKFQPQVLEELRKRVICERNASFNLESRATWAANSFC